MFEKFEIWWNITDQQDRSLFLDWTIIVIVIIILIIDQTNFGDIGSSALTRRCHLRLKKRKVFNLYILINLIFRLPLSSRGGGLRPFLRLPLYILQYSSVHKILKYGKHTVCPGSIDPFYIVSYYIKWVTTSWTYCIFFCTSFFPHPKRRLFILKNYCCSCLAHFLYLQSIRLFSFLYLFLTIMLWSYGKFVLVDKLSISYNFKVNRL